MILQETVTPFVLVATVRFKSLAYQVTEGDGSTQPVLILSNPLSTDIIVQVTSKDKSAIGIPTPSIRFGIMWTNC